MKVAQALFRAALLLLLGWLVLTACSPREPPVATAKQSGSFASSHKDSAEATRQHEKARHLVQRGRYDEATRLITEALAQYPEDRELHQLYAEILWYQSEGTDPTLLRQSADEATRAAEIGLRSGAVDYTLTARLAETLGRTKDRERLDRIFEQLLAKDPSPTIYLDYATGLALAGDDRRAEDAFRQAVRSNPEGAAAAAYGEWLLDRKRNEAALNILPESSPAYYVHFLRGVALERLGRASEAQAAYMQYREYNRTFPAPPRFRIPGSTAQKGIRFGEPD